MAVTACSWASSSTQNERPTASKSREIVWRSAGDTSSSAYSPTQPWRTITAVLGMLRTTGRSSGSEARSV